MRHLCLLWIVALAACSAPDKAPLGANCEASSECASGLCAGGSCVDPAADSDGDGLTNAIESNLGSDGTRVDTDGDGVADPDELDGLALIDTDGDGTADITESGLLDADGDCVTDQYDSDDAHPTADMTPMVAAVCPTLGICGLQVTELRAACPDGQHAQCVFELVAGYADPEGACDGRDENCDGSVDEGFSGGCATPQTSFTGIGSASGTLATDRYRATLVVGHPAVGSAHTDRYRTLVGNNPGLAPRRPETP